jgi:hypothetical protein
MYARFERFLIEHECRFRDGNFFKACFEKFREDSIFKSVYVDDLNELKKPLFRYECGESNSENWVEVYTEGLGDLLVWKKVRQVRNNLFHGSKALKDKERDYTLIKESLEFLKRYADKEDEYKKYI